MVLPSIQCVFVALSKDVILPNCFTDICCHNRQSFANDTKLIGRACTYFPGLANRAGCLESSSAFAYYCKIPLFSGEGTREGLKVLLVRVHS